MHIAKTLRRYPALSAWLLLLPAVGWLLLFFIAPLFIVLAFSFMQGATYGGVKAVFTLSNYARVIDPLYLSTFLRSLYIAILTTAICLLLGFPLAYFIATRPQRLRYALLLALMVPFWTNFLIRTYAWLTILRTNTGLINGTLLALGVIQQPLPLFGNDFAIVLGLVYGWLPDMVLPIYAASERPIEGVESRTLCDSIRARGHKDVRYVQDMDEALALLTELVAPGDVVLTLGAGNVYRLGERLLRPALVVVARSIAKHSHLAYIGFRGCFYEPVRFHSRGRKLVHAFHRRDGGGNINLLSGHGKPKTKNFLI
jgi:ABC-type uncharacterized transport system permease subunit